MEHVAVTALKGQLRLEIFALDAVRALERRWCSTYPVGVESAREEIGRIAERVGGLKWAITVLTPSTKDATDER